MIKVKLNVTKIDKDKIFIGKKGKYVDLLLVDKPDDFGNDGFVSQGVSQEEREAGQREPIVGDWKHVGQKKPAAPQPKPAATHAPTAGDDDDIPF
jgi:hypothetical protein